MEKFIATDDFKNLNVGFSLDEGIASPNSDYLVFYGERSIWRESIDLLICQVLVIEYFQRWSSRATVIPDMVHCCWIIRQVKRYWISKNHCGYDEAMIMVFEACGPSRPCLL
jgi:hypothetical protein